MPVVSSQIVEDRPQIDGRRSVRERHVDHIGREIFISYLAAQSANAAQIMADRVAQLSDMVDNPPPEPLPEAPPTMTGNGAPDAGLGVTGCCYLDETTGDLYTKTA